MALLTNLGLLNYHYGYFSEALTAWDQAWQSGRSYTDPQVHALVDRAVGELARKHARLGHADELEALFKDLGDRKVTGPATEAITGAREGLVVMRTDPGIAYLGEMLCQTRTSSDAVTRRYYTEGEYLPAAGTSLYYSQDHLGSVRDVLATQNGNRVASFDYDPYGSPIASSGRVSTDFRYAGLFYDQQHGLYLANHRAYDFSSHSWLSRDPMKEAGGYNLYSYVSGNPLSATDVTGLYQALQVTVNGMTYTPMTKVKNEAQELAFGEKVGTCVPIPVPSEVDPQQDVDYWAKERSTTLMTELRDSSLR